MRDTIVNEIYSAMDIITSVIISENTVAMNNLRNLYRSRCMQMARLVDVHAGEEALQNVKVIMFDMMLNAQECKVNINMDLIEG